MQSEQRKGNNQNQIQNITTKQLTIVQFYSLKYINIFITNQSYKMNESDLQQATPIKKNKNHNQTFNETFESSILDKPERFLLDKTLVKGIKQNDPSKIVENGEEADIGQSTTLYDQEKQISDIFVNTRKNYDRTKQTAVKVEQRIQKLKKQKDMLDAEKTKIQNSFTEEEKEFKNIQNQLEKLNDMCEAAQYAKDVRIQIGQVLRQDILYYKKHSFEANGKIVRNLNKLKSLTGQYESSKKVSSNCKSLVYSIQKKICDKQNQRYDKINSFHEIINKKLQNNVKREERQKMIEESMLQALNGKMPEQQQQKKLLMVNLVLKKMLKLKMQRQMAKFNETQTTFRKIKQNTTVKRADQFIQRFIKRQRNYGELLESISKNQDKITALKQEQQVLLKENHDIMFQKQAIQDRQNQKKEQANKQLNTKIDILRQKLIHNQGLKNKTLSFTSKFIAGFDQKGIDDVKQRLSREKPNLSLKQVLQRMLRFLNSIKQEDSSQKLKQIYIESKNLTLPASVKGKNMRIKTLSTHDQNQHSAMQDHDVAYDDLSQREFLNQNRKQIKKSAYLRNRMKTRAN